MVNQDMTFLIRHLAPTEHGLPIEIYVFCSDIVWANYEAGSRRQGLPRVGQPAERIDLSDKMAVIFYLHNI